jgi:hypothetical protein
MAMSTCWTVAVAVACSAILAACGGGSSEEQAGCTHASIPSSGPGDVDHYFPVEVGRTWTYDSLDPSLGPGTKDVTVGSPTIVQGQPASVFTTTWTAGTQSGEASDVYAVRPAGVYLVSSTDEISPLDQALPELVLPFPVLVTSAMQQVTCKHLQFVEEGTTIDSDIVVYVSINSLYPSLDMNAGTFFSVAEVLTSVDLVMRSSGTTVTGHIMHVRYYAPQVGMILSSTSAEISGYTSPIEDLWLRSYTTPSPDAVPVGPRTLAAVTDRSIPSPKSPEEVALWVARRLARTYR